MSSRLRVKLGPAHKKPVSCEKVAAFNQIKNSFFFNSCASKTPPDKVIRRVCTDKREIEREVKEKKEKE